MNAQRGVTLFVALIVLVALSLAGVALMRSTDSANVITGNLGFKKAALHATDQAVQRAAALLTGQGALPADWTQITATQKEAHLAARNYRATMFTRGASGAEGLDAQGIPLVLVNAPVPSSAGAAAGYGGVAGFDDANVITDAATGHTIRWVIDRMCRQTGAANATHCSMTASTEVNEGTLNERYFGTPAGPYFRVTIRVDGPRNTVTYTQVLIRDT
jgi:type IV pilus assembly protein PilX